MLPMQYGTSYGRAFGENERQMSATQSRLGRTAQQGTQRVNMSLTQRQAPMTLEQQGYASHGPGPMAKSATMPHKASYNFTNGDTGMQVPFTQRKYQLPDLVAVPNKQEFYPVGTRVPLKKSPHPYQLIPDPTYGRSEPVINMNGRMQSQYRCYSDDQYSSASEFGKASICRRFPEKERLRYHITGYMGHVSNQQNHHGSPYGPTTRKCIFKEELDGQGIRT